MISPSHGAAIAGPSRVSARMSTHLVPRALVGRGRSFASTARTDKEKLVVLGSGWAGYNVARQVNKSLYDVTVVSPRSHFSFTPFLASAAVGTLEFRCTTEPVRGIKGVHYAQGWANEIDFTAQTVEVEPALPAVPDFEADVANKPHAAPSAEHYRLEYDKLVIAVGCYSQDFGIPGVKKHAHFLKDVNDSRAIRLRLLEILEQATLPGLSAAQQRDLLRIAVVGGGPTGVEFAAEVHDFVEEDVYRMYPHLKGLVNITLYDVAPHILGSFDESLRKYAERKFSRDGVQVRGGSNIKAVGEDWLELERGKREPFGLLVWNTGLAANPLMARLKGLSHDEKTQSLHVSPHLQPLTTSHEPIRNVFAIGDNALPFEGARLPATAQVASQMAKWVAKGLNKAGAAGNGNGAGVNVEDGPAFEWKNRGSMVFVGDYRALVDRSSKTVEGIKSRLSGPLAWFLWRSYYMTLAMGWRNKLLVPMYWTLAFFFGRDITRF